MKDPVAAIISGDPLKFDAALRALLRDPRVPVRGGFEDRRGVIQPIYPIRGIHGFDPMIGSVQLITAHRGQVRGSHYHLSDWHFCYVVEGEMQYHWRNLDHYKIG